MTDRLQNLIGAACSPANSRPDPSINLEICELINEKQGTFPRVAALTIVGLVNSKHQNQAMLALSLLGTCVKHCGYPFHLQMGTKEFLNALVRRFPSRPQALGFSALPPAPSHQIHWNHFDYVPHQPSAPDPIIGRILYMIKLWKIALVDKVPYKDDIINIKHMYRLLRQNGYRFPEVRESSIAELAPTQTLKTPEELEKEDNARLSAKLQELIRRGTPSDLVDADVLMKRLSGYHADGKPNFSKQFGDQLRGFKSKAIVLYELLEGMKPGGKIDRPMQELQKVCDNAFKKTKQIIEHDEIPEYRDTLLAFSSLLEKVLAKYSDIQHGKYDTYYDIHDNTSSVNRPQRSTEESVSLIDLDEPATPSISRSPSLSNGSPIRLTDELPSFTSTPDSEISLVSASPKHIPHSPSANALTAQLAALGIHDDDSRSRITLYEKNGLRVDLQILDSSSTVWNMRAYFSNLSTAPMEEIDLQLAAPKSMEIKMGGVSSSVVPPKSDMAIFQNVALKNPNMEPLRLRFKVTYYQFGVQMEQTGEYHASNQLN